MTDEENVETQDVDLSDEDDAKVDTPPASGGTGGLTTTSEVVASTKAWFNEAKGFAYVELCSLVLMFSCIGEFQKYSDGLLIYAIIVAVFSLAACLGIQTGEYMQPGFLDKNEKMVSLGLLLWWAVGAWVITFRGPFTVTSNGYFAAWGGLIFTFKWALNMDTAQFTGLPYDRKLLLLLAICGMLEVFSCIKPLVEKTYVGQSAWGMTAGALTFCICGFLFKGYVTVKFIILKVTAALLFTMWATVAGLLTFGGPFNFTGNGYFASWGGFFLSAMFGLELLAKEDQAI
ncbi:hypothetical protein ACHAXN_007875 [Cyclotella atomus]|jgi:hypothetical protein